MVGKSKCSESGFSLIEVLLAMGILSIGLLAVLTLFLGTSKFNTNGNITTMANMVAQKKIEKVCTGKIKDTSSSLSRATNEGFLIRETNVNADGETTATGGIFTVETRVFNYTGDPDLKRVSVSVLWTRNGQSENITYSAVTRGNTIEI